MNRLILLLGIVSLSAVGCLDPLRESRIEELGPEQDGFGEDEFHRVGQPCLACHDGYGPGEPVMVFGGTIFAEPLYQDLVVLEGFTIRIIDSEGQIFDTVSNRCGNFFIEKGEFDPAFPVRAELWGPPKPDSEDVIQLRPMTTRIGRDGSCGSCHIHPTSPVSPGVVYVPEAFLPPAEELSPPTDCPEPRFAEVF